MLKAIIVDDQTLAISSLTAELEDHFSQRVKIVGKALGVMEAAKLIKSENPDVIFLDIHMNDGDGFDLLDIVNSPSISIIFTTASQDHALKAFQYAAVDYLLKPVDQKQLERALGKIESAGEELGSTKDVLTVSTQESLRLVSFESITRLMAEGNYTRIYLKDGKMILASKTLKSFEERLDSQFIRTHQSHLININYVQSYIKEEGGYILMEDGSQIPVSVRKKALVLSELKSIK